MVAFLAASGVQAKSLRQDTGPAEYPPASYKSDQYVDSKGCVYIRAGYAGQVNWVPRVSRGRDVMCGFKPTFAQKTAPAPAPKVAKPVPKAQPKVVAKPAPVATKPAPQKVVRKPAPQVITTQPARKQKPVAVQPQKPSGNCPGASEFSQRYINNGSKYPVRCGPQGTSPYNDGAMRMAPSGMRQVAALPAPKVPAGYKPAWTDGRLNPNRGIGTVYGEIEMQQVWSETVPRVPVAQTKGVKYVYVTPQQAAPVARISSKSAPAQPKVVTKKKKVVAKPTAPQAKAKARLIQVGSYSDPRNAQAVVARLQAMGLPVSKSRGAIKGKPVEVIFAGPIGGPNVNSALGAVRKAGFRDAFVR